MILLFFVLVLPALFQLVEPSRYFVALPFIDNACLVLTHMFNHYKLSTNNLNRIMINNLYRTLRHHILVRNC